MTLEANYGVPTVAVHTDRFDRVVRSVSAGERDARPPAGVRAPAHHGQDGGRAVRVRGRPRSDHGPARHAGDRRGAHAPLRGGRPRAPRVRAHDAAARRAGQRGQPCIGCSSTTTGRTCCRSSCPRRRGSRRCCAGRGGSPTRSWGACGRRTSASPGSYTVEKVAVNAVMAGARPEYLPRHPGARRDGRDGAEQQLERHGVDGGGERAGARRRSG